MIITNDGNMQKKSNEYHDETICTHEGRVNNIFKKIIEKNRKKALVELIEEAYKDPEIKKIMDIYKEYSSELSQYIDWISYRSVKYSKNDDAAKEAVKEVLKTIESYKKDPYSGKRIAHELLYIISTKKNVYDLLMSSKILRKYSDKPEVGRYLSESLSYVAYKDCTYSSVMMCRAYKLLQNKEVGEFISKNNISLYGLVSNKTIFDEIDKKGVKALEEVDIKIFK